MLTQEPEVRGSRLSRQDARIEERFIAKGATENCTSLLLVAASQLRTAVMAGRPVR
jgi:hypothetical protein